MIEVNIEKLSDYDYLYDLRVNRKLQTEEIAKLFGVSNSKVLRAFKKLGIPTKNPNSLAPELSDREILEDLYINKGQSIAEIAKNIGSTSFYVSKALINFKIPTRNAHESDLLVHEKRRERYYNPLVEDYNVMYDLWVTKNMSIDEVSKFLKMPKKPIKRAISALKIDKNQRRILTLLEKIPEDLKRKEILEDLYIKQKKSLVELSREYKVTVGSIKKVLDYFNIPRRTQKEAAKLLCGEKSPHWKGGSSSIYERLRAYSRDNIHKKVIERDNHTCQMEGCGCTENLHAHHKVPLWKIYTEILEEHPELDINDEKDAEELLRIMKADSRVNDLDNFITYCETCHLFKVHGYTKNQVKELSKRTGQNFAEDD